MVHINVDAIRAFLDDHGMPHLLDADIGLVAAFNDGTLVEFLDAHGADHLHAGLTRLLTTTVCGFELADGSVAYYEV